MFSLAYVILPFSDTPLADAIRASLARFQRGLRGDIPDEWLAFADETDALRQAHETRFTFTDKGKHGLQVEGGHGVFWYVDTNKVRDEMRRHGRDSWDVRFADFMDLDTFVDHYGCDLECWRSGCCAASCRDRSYSCRDRPGRVGRVPEGLPGDAHARRVGRDLRRPNVRLPPPGPRPTGALAEGSRPRLAAVVLTVPCMAGWRVRWRPSTREKPVWGRARFRSILAYEPLL